MQILKNIVFSTEGKMKSEKYKKFVRTQHCCHCGIPPENVAHHVRLKGSCGTGKKPSDLQTVSLCPSCHYEVHQLGGFPEERWLIETIEKAIEHGILKL